MKVVLINHSDSLGGASVVTYRLLKALQAQGIEARMLVVHKATDDPSVVVAAPHWRAKIPFYIEAAKIFAANGHDRGDLFKVSLGSDGLPLSRHPLVRGADAVLLAWVNQGMLSLKEIGRIAAAKPVIWTMHDMWNLTALCHHAGECRKYAEPAGCRQCPFLHSKASDHDASTRVWRDKQQLYGTAHIKFVAVSSWLGELCRQSRLIDAQSVSVIPNAFPVEEFYSAPPSDGRRIILMGAARLDDPVKGLPLAVDMLNRVTRRDNAEVRFFGTLRDPHALDGLNFKHQYLGPVNDPARLRELYSQAHTVISTSLYETLPGTLIEGQAAGAMPVSFDRGGQADIIRGNTDGRLIPFGDTTAMAAALDEVLATDHDRDALRKTVAQRFSAPSVARKYIELLELQLSQAKS